MEGRRYGKRENKSADIEEVDDLRVHCTTSDAVIAVPYTGIGVVGRNSVSTNGGGGNEWYDAEVGTASGRN
jgi:hypothetical protein